jgi:predicted dinucleotide-binding enzyme
LIAKLCGRCTSGIIGSGKIGATAARRFVDVGHEVVLANSRGAETLTDDVRRHGEHATTSTELLAAHAPDARVVKAFNTMQWMLLRDRGSHGPMDGRLALFVAGDDQEAKRRVSELIDEIGFAPIDTGSLAEGGRRQQPGSSVFVNELGRDEARVLLGEPR